MPKLHVYFLGRRVNNMLYLKQTINVTASLYFNFRGCTGSHVVSSAESDITGLTALTQQSPISLAWLLLLTYSFCFNCSLYKKNSIRKNPNYVIPPFLVRTRPCCCRWLLRLVRALYRANSCMACMVIHFCLLYYMYQYQISTQHLMRVIKMDRHQHTCHYSEIMTQTQLADDNMAKYRPRREKLNKSFFFKLKNSIFQIIKVKAILDLIQKVYIWELIITLTIDFLSNPNISFCL